MRKKQAIDGLVTSGGQLLQQVLGFVGGVLVAKLLGPGDYGEVAVLRNILQIALVLTPLGLDLAIYKILPQFDAAPHAKALHLRRFRIIAFGFSIALLVAGSSAADIWLGSAFHGYPDFSLNLAITLLALPFATDLVILMSSYRVENRIIPIMLITSYLQPVMRTCLNVAAVLMGFGVLGVVIGTTAAYAVAAIAALAYGLAAPLTREAAPAGQVAASWRESWRLFLGAPSMALNMFVYSTMRSADIIIVGSLAPADDVGRYAVLSTLSQLVTVATVALSQTLGPAIARHFQAGNLRAIRDDTNRYIRLASIVSSFVFGGVAVFGNHLDVIFGETYHTEGAVLILIPLGYLLSATLAPASFALTMGGKAGLDLAILVASAVGLVVACVALTSWFGIVGTATGVLLAFAGASIVRLVAANRFLGEKIGRVWDLIPPVVAFGTASAASAWLVPSHPSFLQLLLGCLCYTLIYGVYGFLSAVSKRWHQ